METHAKYKKKAVAKENGKIMSIFLVDDDPSYLYPLGFYLQKNTPHMVYCYTSGEECLGNIYHIPDIIILDYNLDPEAPNVMNGLEVLKEVKYTSPKTKVVMLSGRDTVKGVIDSMKLGAYTYIVKDVEALASLKKVIDTIANEKAKDD